MAPSTQLITTEAEKMNPAKKKAFIGFYMMVKRQESTQQELLRLRNETKTLAETFNKSEFDINYFNTCGEQVGELKNSFKKDKYIVAVGHQVLLVNARTAIDTKKLIKGVRTTHDTRTSAIVRILPREVNNQIYSMISEDPGDVSYTSIGGLQAQLRDLREVIELPLLNPEIFKRVGIVPPKGVLLYGPPGTGKTLLARVVAKNMSANFMKVVASSIVDKYIGESARLIRDMFAYARNHTPCVIFIDEIDAIGGRRLSGGNSSDREIQRTMMELLTQLDGFDQLDSVKIIMATNRPDTLDPALLRPGRIDRKIEIPLPNEVARLEVLKIYGFKMPKSEDINWEAVVKESEGFNCADLRNICTEAGIFAIKQDRDYVVDEDFSKAVKKMIDQKKLESKLDYKPL